MKPYIEKRVMKVAHHIINTNETIRQTAIKFGVSKASIHRDLQKRLPEIDENLSDEIKVVMTKHNMDRYKNGGAKTKEKYDKIRIALES
jgi:putative DeoR family transcriptional regulator (stage III sporulation protein D)